MSCAQEEDLTAYVDEELPPARRAELEAHLGTCASCRATEALLRGTVARLAELPAFTPSRDTRRQVLARVDALPVPLRQRLLALLRPAVLMPAVGLATAVGFAVYLTAEPPLEDMDPGLLELAANLEMVEDYEVLGLDDGDDLEVVAHLHELDMKEGQP